MMTVEANWSQNAALSRAYKLETLGDTKFSNKEAVEEKRCQDKEMNIVIRFDYISDIDEHLASAKLQGKGNLKSTSLKRTYSKR